MDRITVRNRSVISISRNPVERFLMKVKDFLSAHRKAVLICSAGILAAAVIAVCLTFYFNKRADSLLVQYESIMNEYYASPEAGSEAVSAAAEKLKVLIDDSSFGSVYERALLALGNLYYENGNCSEACEALCRYADECSAEFPAALALVKAGCAAEENGDAESALKIYLRAEQKYGDGAAGDRIAYSLGRVYAAKGDMISAKRYFEKVSSEFPFSALQENAKKRLYFIQTEK